MGKLLPDEAKTDIDHEYLKELVVLGDDEECCCLIPCRKDTSERVGTCSFMISEDGKTYDIAYCVHQSLWNRGYATEIAKGLIRYAGSCGTRSVFGQVVLVMCAPVHGHPVHCFALRNVQ